MYDKHINSKMHHDKYMKKVENIFELHLKVKPLLRAKIRDSYIFIGQNIV